MKATIAMKAMSDWICPQAECQKIEACIIVFPRLGPSVFFISSEKRKKTEMEFRKFLEGVCADPKLHS
jgi:hypothetical protein